MYELFKLCADEFYLEDEFKKVCQKVPVFDKMGNLVETKYKLSSSGKCIYTINMYHKKSSCLVNGKQERLFTHKHREEIFRLVENQLKDQHLSLEQLNCQRKRAIEICMFRKDKEMNDSKPNSTSLKYLNHKSPRCDESRVNPPKEFKSDDREEESAIIMYSLPNATGTNEIQSRPISVLNTSSAKKKGKIIKDNNIAMDDTRKKVVYKNYVKTRTMWIKWISETR